MAEAADITADVLQACRTLGFALAGVCDATPTEYERELTEWLAAGKHGEMAYLARNTSLRIDPREMVPMARSIICVADRYWVGEGTEGRRDGGSKGRRDEDGEGLGFGRVARYARGGDYHRVMKRRLQSLCDSLRGQFPGETFRACVDTAPVLEREHAQRAGLGAVGKHTLLIDRSVGSYLLLGEIITTLALASSLPTAPDPCGTCTRCLDACPTDAITPWSVDATRCISYLTIEHRGVIDGSFFEPIGDWIFGCDICQEVCPHNQPTQRSAGAAVHPAYSPRRDGFDLLAVLGWDESDRRAAFTRSSMKRAKLNMMKRNAVIAAGNALRKRAAGADGAALLRRIEGMAEDAAENEMVRETAGRVLADLDRSWLDGCSSGTERAHRKAPLR